MFCIIALNNQLIINVVLLIRGLVPRLIGEALSVCLANLLTFVVNTYVVSDNKSLEVMTQLKRY